MDKKDLLKKALLEYFEARKNEGALVEDVFDELDEIVDEMIDEQCKKHPIALTH